MTIQAKPLIVFVFPTERADTSTKYAGFARRLQKAGGLEGKEVLTVALENLAFIIRENKEAEVIDTVSKRRLGDADFVYMKGLGDESAALATYLFYRGIPFMDTASLHVRGSKLATAFRMWGSGLRVPFTFYLRNTERFSAWIDTEMPVELGDKFIVKDANGAKGNLNFYVNKTDAIRIVREHPDVQFICQRFVENEGDYRIGVYACHAKFIIKRAGKAGSHLNNTSAGGVAEYIPIEAMPKAWLRLAENAAAAASLQIAGVDIIVDKETKQPYVLEVNQGSQIVTGAYTEQNIQAFNEALDDSIRARTTKTRLQPTTVIGRRSIAKLPELGIAKAVAKIDTGAYTSTLHAEDIHIEYNAKGEEELVFTIGDSDRLQHDSGSGQHRQKYYLNAYHEKYPANVSGQV